MRLTVQRYAWNGVGPAEVTGLLSDASEALTGGYAVVEEVTAVSLVAAHMAASVKAADLEAVRVFGEAGELRLRRVGVDAFDATASFDGEAPSAWSGAMTATEQLEGADGLIGALGSPLRLKDGTAAQYENRLGKPYRVDEALSGGDGINIVARVFKDEDGCARGARYVSAVVFAEEVAR